MTILNVQMIRKKGDGRRELQISVKVTQEEHDVVSGIAGLYDADIADIMRRLAAVGRAYVQEENINPLDPRFTLRRAKKEEEVESRPFSEKRRRS